MVVNNSTIQTGVDKLVSLVREQKKISVKDAARELGVSNGNIEEWADFLEEAGLITIQTKFATLYLLERQLDKKAIVHKLKEVKEEKDEFLRKVESSVNSLQRDSSEIKLVNSEFKKIQEMILKNSDLLQSKLKKLDDFKESQSELDVKESSIEKEYEKKFRELEIKLESEQKSHEKVISDIGVEMQRLTGDAKKLDELKEAQKDVQSKVREANSLLSKIQREIDKESEDIASDKEQIGQSLKSADVLKKDISETASNLSKLTKNLKESRKDFKNIEDEFKKDLDSLSQGRFEKIGAYKESKKVIDKFDKFMAESKKIKTLIEESEKEESDLHKKYLLLAKKAQMFQAVTSSPKIKKDLLSLNVDLEKIEGEKSKLSGNLKKLRLFMRSVMK